MEHVNRVIPRSYDVAGSETDDCIEDDVSRYKFSHKHHVKMERVVSD
jgi:hypothetical protein